VSAPLSPEPRGSWGHICATTFAEVSSACGRHLLTGVEAKSRPPAISSTLRFQIADVTASFEIESKVDFVLHMASPQAPDY